MTDESRIGEEMLSWAKDLFPLDRSLTGEGVRATLRYLAELLPLIEIEEVPSHSPAFDWRVPEEWVVRDAHIIGPDGKTVVDFKTCNLHLVGYSTAVHEKMSLEALQAHLHSDPRQPDAIPYVTSYYERSWGFCLTHAQRQTLTPGTYEVVIDSSHFDGALSYGECVLAGEDEREILLSTNICHPSLANNELSGPVLATALGRWLRGRPRRFTYRILYIPETIGALVYLSRHLDRLKRTVIAGFTLTCVGDQRTYSYIPSRLGDSYADKVARAILDHEVPSYDAYSFLDRGSDERQYCSPGIDLPVCSVLRSKYGVYPEYHTSLDNFDLVTAAGLGGSFALYTKMITLIEDNRVYRASCLGEPQLGRRKLYPTLSRKEGLTASARDMVNVLAYADGTADVIDIARHCRMSPIQCLSILRTLLAHDLVAPVPAAPVPWA